MFFQTDPLTTRQGPWQSRPESFVVQEVDQIISCTWCCCGCLDAAAFASVEAIHALVTLGSARAMLLFKELGGGWVGWLFLLMPYEPTLNNVGQPKMLVKEWFTLPTPWVNTGTQNAKNESTQKF